MNIILASRQYELKEINVSAEKPPFRISGGNIVANIPSLPGHESASIGKMLERLPGVTSSPEGGYRLNGSEAIVYIDGIKQQVPAEVLHSILESMPASAIEEVELVSLPGSNYDMTKNPVIHIHKKKIRQDGWYIQPSIDGSVMENAHGSAEIQAYFSMQKKSSGPMPMPPMPIVMNSPKRKHMYGKIPCGIVSGKTVGIKSMSST